MTWLEAVPVLIGALGTLIVPGLVLALAIGARGLALAWLTPIFSVSAVAIAAVVNHVVPFRWGPLPVAIVTVVLAAIVFGLRLWWRRRWPDVKADDGRPLASAAAIGALVAFLLIGARLVTIFQQPDAISQTFDNVFHLNAAHYIATAGDASPIRVGVLTSEEVTFYPDGWHAFVALAGMLSGASTPVAINVVNIVIAGIIWPLGCMFLMRVVAGRRPLVLVITGVLSAGFAAFPYLMLDFGVLYPTALAISLLPGVLALVVLVAGLDTDGTLSPPARWLALVGALPGLALAHPSTLMALIAFSTPIAATAYFRLIASLRRKSASPLRYVLVTAAFAAGAALAALILIEARPTSEQAFWGPFESIPEATFSALTGGTVSLPVDIAVTVLMLAGIVSVFHRRSNRWLVFSYLIGAGLYIVVASFPDSTFRYGLSGTWYSDGNRLAALLPAVVLPLAVLGAVWIVDLIVSGVRRFRSMPASEGRRAMAVPILTGAAVALAVGLATQLGPPLAVETSNASRWYEIDNSSYLLTTDERTLLERIDETVPEDAVVAGSPWTGTSLVYTYADRWPLTFAIYGLRDENTMTLLEHLDEAAENPDVCAAAEALGVEFVLDFGPRAIHTAATVFPGLDGVLAAPGFELVDQEGEARLYEITACR